MTPAPGERLVRFVGDRIEFRLAPASGGPLPPGWQAFLRTNLGRAAIRRQEIIRAQSGRLALAHSAWRDIPMQVEKGEWRREITLTETGYFRAKAYVTDEHGRQLWPEGPDAGVSIHPDSYRTANTLYCAFVRMFGPTRTATSTKKRSIHHAAHQC